MPHRAHLFSLRIADALRDALRAGYSAQNLWRDLLAGVTVGIIAIPLAMALAIASGVAPQYGLYTVIVGGFVIALTGGSRYSVSGPTAAFVVILYPVAQHHGLAGLLLATVMAGLLLVAMAYARLGRLIEYIPESVTLGFTGGIAIVIATLQVPDLLGLSLASMPENYVGKVAALAASAGSFHGGSLLLGLSTLAVLVYWPRLRTGIPQHLPALLLSTLAAAWLNRHGPVIDTIGSRFHYLQGDGSSAPGIPPYWPSLHWPWLQPGPDGAPLALTWSLWKELLPAAFTIAMLGAIESLLCAVVLDGMTGTRHSANSELLGQGIGNILAPFFGGITATAAIARSTANYRAGAHSPVAAMIHAVVVLLGLLLLARWLAYLPMPAMAAVLIIVAWNMSEAPKSVRLLRRAPVADVLVFVTCISLTVLFDMVIAITTGILLASVLFMKDLAGLTRSVDVTDAHRSRLPQDGARWKVFEVQGPLFFAAADRVFGELSLQLGEADGILLQLDTVPLLDAGGLQAMSRLVEQCARSGRRVYFAGWQMQPLRTLARARVKPQEGVTLYFPDLDKAVAHIGAEDWAPAAGNLGAA